MNMHNDVDMLAPLHSLRIRIRRFERRCDARARVVWESLRAAGLGAALLLVAAVTVVLYAAAEFMGLHDDGDIE